MGHGLAGKIDQLDRDSQEFMESTAQKLNSLGDQVEEKASALRLEQLEDRIAKGLLAMEQKAELGAMRCLEEQLLELGGYVETKAELVQLEGALSGIKASKTWRGAVKLEEILEKHDENDEKSLNIMEERLRNASNSLPRGARRGRVYLGGHQRAGCREATGQGARGLPETSPKP